MSSDKALLGALRIEWDVVGPVKLDERGKIAFPKLPSKAGLYKFRVDKLDGGFGRYVGETDNLNRRFGHYRNPGPTQATNLRLNALFKKLLRRGDAVEVAIATDRV